MVEITLMWIGFIIILGWDLEHSDYKRDEYSKSRKNENSATKKKREEKATQRLKLEEEYLRLKHKDRNRIRF